MRDPQFALVRALGGRVTPDPQAAEDALAMARLIAEEHADFERLEDARDKMKNHRVSVWAVFHDEFISSVRSVSERQAAWAAIFEDRFIKARAELPSKTLLIEEAALPTLAASWQAEMNPFVVWDRLPDVPLFLDDIRAAAEMLLRIDPARGLRALDTLTFPAIMQNLLGAFVIEDRNLIAEMLQVAPVAFDSEGSWVPDRSVSALLVTDLIVKHAVALEDAHLHTGWFGQVHIGHDSVASAEAAHSLDEVRKKKIPEWLEHAFELLLKRSDGLSIALGYISYLSRCVLLGKRTTLDPNDNWNVFSVALNALATVLGKAAGIINQLENAWRTTEKVVSANKREDVKRRVRRSRTQEHDGRYNEGVCSLEWNGLPWLVGAGRILLAQKRASTEDVKTFWSWFVELLERRDPGLRLMAHGNSFVDIPRQFGYLLSLLDSPHAQWQSAYAALEPQRRRASFAHRFPNETDIDLSSLILIRVGLNAVAQIAHGLDNTDNSTSARNWFFQIYRSACRLWLTAVLDVEHRKRDLVSLCFAFMPHIFGGSLGEALGQTIPPIANEPTMLAEACAYLRANGIEPPTIRALVVAAGADVDTALRDAQQWAEISDDRNAFPEHLRSLARDFSIDFGVPGAISPEAQAQQTQDAFAVNVPWAKALLARLDSDGLSGARVTPLNGVGTIWLVQSTLPEGLRQSFGLAPDIRVLATTGIVRGHDLRRAIEWPEGSSDVDPDLLVCASPIHDLESRLRRVAGPWGQRIAWSMNDEPLASLWEILQQQLPKLDVFAYRDPVHGRAFTGRRDEMDAMSSRLLRGQAVGAFGLRKVGKSSLLEAVASVLDPVGAALAMGKPLPEMPESESLVVWLDVQSLVERSLERIAERLWEGLSHRLRVFGWPMQRSSGNVDARVADDEMVQLLDEAAPSADPLDNLSQLLHAAIHSPQVLPICFILDEYDLLFEGYGGEPGTVGVEKLFQLLRTCAQTSGRVSLALIGRDPVFIRMPHIHGFTNPLLGWVEPYYVGSMSNADGAELLQRLGKRVGLMMAQTTVELVLRWTGGHPLLVREFGASLYASARANGATFPMDTAPLETRAISLFLQRDMVQTICGEIEMLFRTRFPDSWTLLQQVASLPDAEIASELKRDSSMGGRATKVLFDFGLLRGSFHAPQMPQLYREAFGRNVPISQVVTRKHALG